MQTNNQKSPVKIIKSGKAGIAEYIAEVWRYRNLITILAMQDIRAQYIQTKFGFFWVIFKPLIVLALFSFVFGSLIPLPGLQYPYSLFAFTGLIVWNNFSFMVNNAGTVLIANQQLIKKTYFPRIILLLSKTVIGLIEMVVAVALLFVLMIFLRYSIHFRIILLPVFLAAGLLPGLAIAVLLNALTVRYRDLNHFIPTAVGFLIWLTPVFYPASQIPRQYSFLLYFNPLAGAIQGCRWAVLGDQLPGIGFLPSFLFSLSLLVAALLVFIRAEADLADYI